MKGWFYHKNDKRSDIFSMWVFFHEHSQSTGQQEKGEAISLTPLHNFHPLHRRWGIIGLGIIDMKLLYWVHFDCFLIMLKRRIYNFFGFLFYFIGK